VAFPVPFARLICFKLHHFYYGLVLLSVSMSFLTVTKRQRVRWDEALIFGIGAGLCTDEASLLLLKIPYDDPISLLMLAGIGFALLGELSMQLFRDGTGEFRILDRADILTVLSILLLMSGFLYLDRPRDHNSSGCWSCFLGGCQHSYRPLWEEALC